jgi:hypothetical protein
MKKNEGWMRKKEHVYVDMPAQPGPGAPRNLAVRWANILHAGRQTVPDQVLHWVTNVYETNPEWREAYMRKYAPKADPNSEQDFLKHIHAWKPPAPPPSPPPKEETIVLSSDDDSHAEAEVGEKRKQKADEEASGAAEAAGKKAKCEETAQETAAQVEASIASLREVLRTVLPEIDEGDKQGDEESDNEGSAGGV